MPDQSAKTELMDLINRRSAALVNGDLEFFEHLLSGDFCYINASGRVFDKSAYLNFFIQSKQMQWQAQDVDELRVRFYGGIAVIICRIHDRASYQGEAFEGYFRSTQVFVKQADGWRYAAGQTTALELLISG